MVETFYLKAEGPDSETGEAITLDHSPFRVGRKSDNDAQVVRSDISGLHAVFVYENGGWYVHDKGSRNGTFVNGKRVDVSDQLRIGDVVHFATNAFQVVESLDEVSPSGLATQAIGDSGEIKGLVDLVKVLREDRAYAIFQPIVDLASQATIGWECLGRGVGTEGPLSPGLLFWLASRTRAEAKLSRSFRDAALFCAECRHCWTGQTRQLLFVNIHPAEISQPGFLPGLDDFTRPEIINHYQPVIEMPESWACKLQEMTGLCQEIRSRGMLVAYDDFGQGQSRIQDLLGAPPDIIKLDRQLIANLGANKVKYNLVKSVVQACHELNVRVLGEGIETKDEADACTDMGIELGQGYYFCKPQPAYELFKTDPKGMPTKCPFIRLNVIN